MTPKSKYKHVVWSPYLKRKSKHDMEKANKTPWRALLRWRSGLGEDKSRSKNFATEREAALQADKWLLEMGREPVNILKPKL
jgi:hypothetical protein